MLITKALHRASCVPIIALAACLLPSINDAVAMQPPAAQELKLAPASFRAIDVPNTTRLAAIDPVTGVAGVILDGLGESNPPQEPGTAAFYTSLTTAPLPAPIKVDLSGANADQIVPVFHKGERLFLISDDRGSIHLVEPNSGKIRSSIKLASSATSIIASPDGTTVYYTLARDQRSNRNDQPDLRQSAIGAIDLLSKKDLGLLSHGLSSNAHEISVTNGIRIHIAGISPDGQHLYLSRLNMNPSGILAAAPNLRGLSIRLVHQDSRATEAYVVTPLGTVCDSVLRSDSLTREVRKLPHQPLASITGTPFVVGYDRTKADYSMLVVMSLNTSEVVRTIALPHTQRTPQHRRMWRIGEDDAIHYDAATSSLLLDRAEGIFNIKLEALNLPSEPLLGFSMKAERVATIGRAWQAELEPLATGVTLALGEAPDGVKLTGNTVTWTPRLNQVGPTLVPILATGGGTTSTQHIEVSAEVDALRLPFVPEIIAISPDTKYLAIARRGSDDKNKDKRNDPARVAIIELATRKFVMSQLLDFRIAKLAVTNAGTVILADREADALHTITLAKVERTIYTTGRPQHLAIVADQLFVASSGDSGITTAAFSATTFAPVDAEEVRDRERMTRMPRRNSALSAVPIEHEQGWLASGVLRSADLSTIDLVQSFELYAIAPGLNAAEDANPMRSLTTDDPVRWGARLRGGKLERTSGQTIALSKSSQPHILSKHSIALALNAKQQFERSTISQDFSLDIIELATGKSRSLPVLTIEHEFTPHDGNSSHSRSDRIFEYDAGVGGVGVAISDRILFFTYEQLGAPTAAMPLHFVPKQTTLTASTTKPTTLTYEVKGGTLPLTFSLGRTIEGVTIDASSGTVTIDPTKLKYNDVLEQTATQALHYRASPQAAPGEGPPERPDWDGLLKDYRETIKSRTNIEVAGLPIAVRLGIKARDANQQEALLTHEVLLDIPVETLNAAYAKARFATLAKRDEFQRQNPPPPVAIPANPALAAENQRLREEVARLQGQVELLKQMLEEKKKE